MIRKFNSQTIQFKIGTVVVVVILLMALFPFLFTRVNPFGTEGMRAISDPEGHFIIQRAPFAPQWDIPLGTDVIGRHIWSLIVHGTRLTMTLALLVVAGRFLVAIPMGFSAGFGSLVSQTIVKQFSLIFGAIPALLLSVIVLRMNYFTRLEKEASILAFVVVLTIVGWGKLALVIEERVKVLLEEPFIKGEAAIGKNGLQIAVGTVLPHLLPELVVLFFLEMARALSILLQLGIFNVFVGSVRFIEDSSSAGYKYMDLSYEPEWAGMLGTGRNQLRTAPWTVFFPALAFFISVFGLNAFGEGLRDILHRNSGAAWTLDRTKKRILEIWNGKYKKHVIVATVLVIAIPVVAFAMETTRFRMDTKVADDLQLSGGPVLVGNKDRDSTATWIEAAFKQRGLTPLYGDSAMQDYDIGTVHYAKSGSLAVAGRELALTEDFKWIGLADANAEAKLIDWSKVDLYSIRKGKAETLPSKAGDGIIVLDADLYNREAIVNLTDKLTEVPGAKGILWLTEHSIRSFEPLHTKKSTIPAIIARKASVPELWQDGKMAITGDAKATLRLEAASMDGVGRNVVAYRLGEGESVADEAIIYGFSYNAMDAEACKKKLQFAMAFIDALEKDSRNRNRTVIYAFIDGTLGDTFNGIRHFSVNMPVETRKVMLYVDMTQVEGMDSGQLWYGQAQSPISRYYAYTFAVQMRDAMKAKHIAFKEAEVRSEGYGGAMETADAHMGIKRGIPTVSFGLDGEHDDEGVKNTDLEELGRMVTGTMTRNNY